MLTYGNHFVGNNYFLSGITNFDQNYQVYFGKEGYIYLSASATSGDLFPNPIVDDYRYTLSKTGEKLQFSNIIGIGDNQRVYVSAEYGISVKPEYVNEMYTGNSAGYWFNERNIWLNAILDENTSTTQATYKFHRFNKFDTLNYLRQPSYKLKWSVDNWSHPIMNFYDIKNLKTMVGRLPWPINTDRRIWDWDGLQNLECTYGGGGGGMFTITNDFNNIPWLWNFPNLKTASEMFWCCYDLTKIPNTWSTANETVTSGGQTFIKFNAGLTSLENSYHMFRACKLSALPSSWKGLDNLTSSMGMFYEICTNYDSEDWPVSSRKVLKTIPSSWDGLGKLVDASEMFYGVSSLETIPNNFTELTSLQYMAGIFRNCNLSASNISSWSGLEKLWDAGRAFQDTKLSSIPTSWNGLGTNVQYHINSSDYYVLAFTNMFRDSDITAIPTAWPSTWLNYNRSTSGLVIDLQVMFKNCTGLTQSVKPLMDQITAHQTNWYQRGKCRIDYDGMFQGCTNIADRSLSSQSQYSAFFSSYLP